MNISHYLPESTQLLLDVGTFLQAAEQDGLTRDLAAALIAKLDQIESALVAQQAADLDDPAVLEMHDYPAMIGLVRRNRAALEAFAGIEPGAASAPDESAGAAVEKDLRPTAWGFPPGREEVRRGLAEHLADVNGVHRTEQ